jgi:hypothetical protein
MLSYPLATAAISKMRLRKKMSIATTPSTPTFYRNLGGSASVFERA